MLFARNKWWIGMSLLAVVGLAGFAFIGVETYRTAPPIPTFVDGRGEPLATQRDILAGQRLFQRYALMNYGSMFGDGAGLGPDFTADALHQTALTMRATYLAAAGADSNAVAARVQQELKRNQHDPARNEVTLTDGQLAGLRALPAHYAAMFAPGTRLDGAGPPIAITDRGLPAQRVLLLGGAGCRPRCARATTTHIPIITVRSDRRYAERTCLMWSMMGSLR
jgi:nitric oxide reductase subunit B